MAKNVDPAIKDGGIVSTFELSFILDGEAVTASGNLVFDPSMNQERAAELVSPTHDMDDMGHEMDGMGHEHHSDMSQTPWFLVIGIPAVFFVALGAFILKVRRRSN
jgi:hypothetical protein